MLHSEAIAKVERALAAMGISVYSVDGAHRMNGQESQDVPVLPYTMVTVRLTVPEIDRA